MYPKKGSILILPYIYPKKGTVTYYCELTDHNHFLTLVGRKWPL